MSFLDDLLNSPQQLNSVGTGIEAAGSVIGGLSHIEFGQQAQQAADFQAAQLRQNAGQAQATAQHAAYDVDRQAQYTASTALATAAASGGGASDPTVVNLIARNAGEFAYRKAVALYQGDDKARLMNLQADAKEFEGANTKANSDLVGTTQMFAAGTSILKGSARDGSLLQRFGGGGPNSNPNALGGN
ncbi:hypothetical protein UFOVP241_11 [uncultured Caudovirales phage]|uniref:Uncharacterized protein n=1 Tax=uncultured Caudovirales phage TaxID=2100421 RepID=A0A6J7WS53_9CAUD|nr:hypothetical protein UFOVP241_11 [uncultured Caudovirales phage]